MKDDTIRLNGCSLHVVIKLLPCTEAVLGSTVWVILKRENIKPFLFLNQNLSIA
jgi:hypothetical protein